jgi:hypothetical protein
MMENISVDGGAFLSDEVLNTLKESQFYFMQGQGILNGDGRGTHSRLMPRLLI